MQNILKLPDNYKTLPTGELLELKLRMEERIDMIDSQIFESKNMTQTPQSGFGSKIWQIRANAARNAYARDIQRIQIVLKSTNETCKKPVSRLENSFMTIARRRLDETVYNSIMHEAQEEL